MKLYAAKKIRIMLAIMAFVGCASAFAADQAASVQPVSGTYSSYCHDGYGHGRHHGCGW